MQSILDLLDKKEDSLKKLQKTLEEELKHLPTGSLRCKCKKKKYNQYYWYREEYKEKYPEGRFLRRSEQEIIVGLSQKEYDLKLKEEIKDSLFSIEKLRKAVRRNDIIDDDKILKLHETMSNQKRKIEKSYVKTNEEYISDWLEKTKGQKNKMPIETVYTTEKGEYVRSKSEKIIADKLFFHQIPYVYEAELYLKNIGTIYPDFTILDVKRKRVLYWEHFGMMDEETYCISTISKLQKYEKSGIWPGEQLIFTMEASIQPLNTKNLDEIIAHYFEE